MLKKLAILFVLVIGLIWLVGKSAIVISRDALEKSIIEHSVSLAGGLIDKIDREIYHNMEIIYEYANELQLKELLRDSILGYESRDVEGFMNRMEQEWQAAAPNEITSFMYSLILNDLIEGYTEKEAYYREQLGYTLFRNLLVTNKFGAIVAQNYKADGFRQDGTDWWRQAMREGTHIGPVQFDQAENLYFKLVAVRIVDEFEQILGVIKVEMNMAEVIQIINTSADRERSQGSLPVEYQLVTEAGELIYSTSGFQFLDDVSYLLADNKPQEWVNVSIIQNPNEENTLSICARSLGFKSYRGSNWFLVVEHPVSAVFAPLVNLRNGIYLATTLVTILAILTMALTFRTIVRPIMNLRDATIEIGRGNLDAPVEVGGEDELGQLSASFNFMVSQLKETMVSRDRLLKEIELRKEKEQLLQNARDELEQRVIERTRQLENARDDLQRLIERANVPIFGVDGEGQVNAWNRTAEELTGVGKHEIEGKKLVDQFAAGGYRYTVTSILERALSGHSSTNIEISLFGEKGRDRLILVNSTPRLDADGNIVGVICVGQDITDRKRSVERLRLMAHDLQAVLDVVDELIGFADLDSFFKRAVELGRERLGIERCAIFIRDGDLVKGTYGTDQFGEITDERNYKVAIDGVWEKRFQLLQPNAKRWYLSEEKRTSWDGKKAITISIGWVAVTPIQSSQDAIGVFVNDALLSGAAANPTKQDVIAVFCSFLGNLAQRINVEAEREILAKFPSENPNPIFRASKEGQLLYANKAGEPLLRTWNCRIGEPMPESWRLIIGNCLAEKCNKEINVVVADKAFSFLIAPVLNLDTVYLFGWDVTERREAVLELVRERQSLARRVAERTADLRAANAELSRATRLKDEFLASMSHELRTPLNAVLGQCEVLREELFGPLTERQRKSLRSIDASGRHLLALINDILDLSKIEAGKIELQNDTTAIRSLCQMSIQFVSQMAMNKRIRVETSIDEQLSTIIADERRLKQILVNLLSNAVKFTPPGESIGLKVTGDRDRQLVHFTVWDTGIGISKDDLFKLFKPFVQLDSSLSREHAGTGLGLSLVAKLTELHGGGISVESEPDKGSSFTVTIPWRKPQSPNQRLTGGKYVSAATTGASMLPILKNAPEGPLILLAEDNEENIGLLKTYLHAKGFRVIVSRNGRDAVEQVREKMPRIVLMDIQMPEINGLEAIRLIRADQRHQAMPIIALTALAMPGDRERCIAAGANDYVTKPIALNELMNTIATLVT